MLGIRESYVDRGTPSTPEGGNGLNRTHVNADQKIDNQ